MASDPWMDHAIEVIMSDYGVYVSAQKATKDVLKFGRSRDIETALATLMTLPDDIDNETDASTNIITTVVSSSGSDTGDVVLEGHTIDGSNFTSAGQTVTLTGQTGASLSTPLARIERGYNAGSTDLVGTISVTEDDTFSSGVPDTDAGVHLQIFAGRNQSEKASLTTASDEYLVVTGFYCDMLTKAASFADVMLEVRLSGKVFRNKPAISCTNGLRGVHEFKPYFIVPPNSDVRLRGTSDSASGRDVSGGIQGVILT